jgi:hypothetical protein
MGNSASLRLFSFILSAAYWVNCVNWSSVSTFLALANISRHISLKTRSAHPSLASSINSLQAVNKISFMLCKPSLLVLLYGIFTLVCCANSLRFENMDLL